MESGGGGHAARVGDQPDPCQCVPPLRRRPLGPPVAKTSGSRAGDRLQVRGRYGLRLPVRGGWEATPRGPQGQAGAVRPVAPRGQDPADRVRAVRRLQPSRRWAATPGDVRLSGLHALLRQDQDEQVHGQAEDASQAPGPQAEGNPRRDATPHARSRAGAASVAASSAERSLSVLRRDLQLSIIACVQGMRRQALAQDARQPQPKGPHELGDLPPAPDRLPPPGTGDPPGMAAMIDSPRVLSEEPTAVTPHGGICGGESQQWLSYPTKPHVRLCVQRRLACSAGERPAGARVRGPVVWIAGWRETKTLKPIDNVSLGEMTSHRAVTTVNAKVASKVSSPEGRAPNRRVKAAWGAEI